MIAEIQPKAISRPRSDGPAPLPLFDLLRAIAVMSVLAWHLADAVQYNGMPIFKSAAFAVDLFMIVSGFLMFYNYSEREAKEPWNARTTWYAFWLRRYFRIAPLYYTMILGTFVFKDYIQIKEFTLSLYLTFLFPFFPNAIGSLYPDWSIGLEMQFYFFFPLLAWTLRKYGSGAFFTTTTIVAAVTQVFVTYYAGTKPGLLGWLPQPMILPLKIHIFTVGMIAAKVYLEGREQLRSKWFYVGFVALAFTCSQNYMRLMAIGYFFLFLTCSHPKTASLIESGLAWLNRVCGKIKPLNWTAELSYSVYLVHAVLFITVFFQFYPNLRSGGAMTTPQFVCWYVGAFLLVNTLSAITHFLIEKPGMKLGRFLAKKVTGQTRSAAPNLGNPALSTTLKP